MSEVSPSPATADILGCQFDNVDMAQSIDQLCHAIKTGERTGIVCTVNASYLMHLRKDPDLASVVANSLMTVADGQAIVCASRILGRPLPERIAGIDLALQVCEQAQHQGARVFLLGGTDEVIEKTRERFEQDFPNLTIAGSRNGYFSLDDADQVADDVRAANAGLLLVAMGVPRQEYFMSRTWDTLGVNVAIGVGGSFDVYAGLTKRAPNWMRAISMEWFYRTLQEPMRLGPRYARDNSAFIVATLLELVASKFGRTA